MRIHNLHKTSHTLWRIRFLALSLVFASSAIALASQAPSCDTESRTVDRPEARVREFLKAFNAHDTKRMLDMVDEKIQWISVVGETAPIEAEGMTALKASMDRYFKGCPSCKSSLEWVQSAANRVTTLERAEWIGKNGAKSQKSLAVYEFRGDKISRVYYFPAEVTNSRR